MIHLQIEVDINENRYTVIDDVHSDEELRFKTIGRVEKILFVVYTERDEATRIISARKRSLSTPVWG